MTVSEQFSCDSSWLLANIMKNKLGAGGTVSHFIAYWVLEFPWQRA
jgi:hypothetical protein